MLADLSHSLIVTPVSIIEKVNFSNQLFWLWAEHGGTSTRRSTETWIKYGLIYCFGQETYYEPDKLAEFDWYSEILEILIIIFGDFSSSCYLMTPFSESLKYLDII